MPRNSVLLASVTFMLVSLAITPAAAQTPQLSGRTEARFGVAVDGSLPIASAELELRLDGEVGAGFFPDASYSAAVRTGIDASTGANWIELDEAYGVLYLGDFEVAVGKQRRSWGSTDGVNPVDILNPRDMTFPPEASKLAVPMLYGTLHSGDARVQLAVVPLFTASRLPGAAWQAPLTPSLPPGARLVGVLPPEIHEPETTLANIQFGVRATFDLDAFDVSATYFSGFRTQPTPSARLVPAGAPGEFRLQPVLRYDRVQLIGLDFSGVVGDVVLRGEAAYAFTADPSGVDPAVSNPYLQAVVGAEYAIPSGPRVVLQGVLDYTAPDADGEAELELKAMTVLTYQAGARTRLDLAWMQSLEGSGLAIPGVAYTFADGVVGEAKAYVFYGAAGSEFGGWKENSQLRLSVAYSF